MQVVVRAVVALVVVSVWVPGLSAQPLSFVNADTASAGGARAIVVADFNRDGWPDIAEAGVDTNSVSVLLNVLGDHFSFAHAVPVGTGPFDLATGDVNRDGIPDLVVTNADSDSISILIGRGDGRFNRSDISTAPHRSPRGIGVGDVNGDGTLDLIYSSYDSNPLQVLLGTGTGAFVKGPTLIGRASRPQGLEAADFNRDGRLDVVAAYDSAGGLVMWYGSDGTTFTPVAVAGESDLNVVATADLNGDGWLDVVAASTSRGRVAVYLGTPSGLVFTRSYLVDTDPRGIAIADVNGDGVPDVITASRSTSTVNVLLGDAMHRGSFLSGLTFAAGRGSRAVAAADFNADGRIDLATGNQYVAAASVLSNVTPLVRAAYTFGERTLAAAPRAAGLGLDAADFNGDGKLDVVTSAGSPFSPDGVMVLLTDGPALVLPVPEGVRLAGFLVGDFNADGNPDIVYWTRDQYGFPSLATHLLTHLGNGRGAFTALPLVTPSSVFSACVAADLDSDGRLDLVCSGAFLRGNGNGTFSEGLPIVAGGDDLQVADVNRDGRLDVVTLHDGCCGESGYLEVWLGDGNGRFSGGERVENLMGESFRHFPQCLRLADLNHDGYLDIVVYRGEGQLGVALGSASGFASVSEVWRDFEVRYPEQTSVSIADIDVDGQMDIITPLGWVLRGRGDGSFEPAERFAFLGQSVLVADVTGDGLPDILHTGLIDDSDDPPPPAFNGVRVLVNQRSDVNHPPVVAVVNRTWDYQDMIAGDGCAWLRADAIDLDQHAITFEWRDRTGAVVSSRSTAALCDTTPGTYRFEVTVRDGRGAELIRPAVLTILPGNEIVLYAVDQRNWVMGNWSQVGDATAAGGFRAYDQNLGAPKITVPGSTASGLVIEFAPDPTLIYKLWVRLKAERNAAANDSVWVQFSGSTDRAGTPAYRLNSTSGLAVSLEECLNCGVAGWGWADDGWGARNTNGVLLRFPESNRYSTEYIYIQTREDGVSVDQVVLSAEKYLTAPPGAATHDVTILPKTFPVRSP